MKEKERRPLAQRQQTETKRVIRTGFKHLFDDLNVEAPDVLERFVASLPQLTEAEKKQYRPPEKRRA